MLTPVVENLQGAANPGERQDDYARALVLADDLGPTNRFLMTLPRINNDRVHRRRRHHRSRHVHRHRRRHRSRRHRYGVRAAWPR